MEKLLYYLPALMCPIGMGLMMWMMMRDKKDKTAEPGQSRPTAQEQELARLRNEIAALRDERAAPLAPPVDVTKPEQ